MKKLLSSMPSTKPDIFYESQPTFSSNFDTPTKSFQNQLQNVINQLKKAHRHRSSLLPRDLQQIFKTNINIFVQLLSVTSSTQLWDLVNPNKQPELSQHMQLNLLLTMLLEMNKSKYRCADVGNIKRFDELRTVIEWFIQQILQFQTHLRQKIQQQIISSCQAQRKRRQAQFHKYEESTKRQFQMMQEIRIVNLNRRLNQQRYHKEHEIKDKIANNMHRIRASSQLKSAKDTTLMKKLAPYRWDKKRIYEESTYKQTIDDILDNDGQRRLRVIENMKKVEKEKLKRAHDNLVSTQQMRAQIERDRMMISLTNQRTQFKNNEEKRLKNLKHSLDMVNQIKINHLKKSLQAFTRHEDTLKIKQIMTNHHYKAQFSQQIDEIVKPQIQLSKINTRYLTINAQRQTSNTLNKSLYKHQNRLQKHLRSVIGVEQPMRRSMGVSGRQKSIVDLYDNQLKLI